MKSVLTALVGIALGALLFSVPLVGAAGGDGTGPVGQGQGFVDKDGDGICDHYQDGAQKKAGAKGHGRMMNGRCCKGQAAGFVDKDGDGVCDHYQDGGQPMACVKGQGRMMNGRCCAGQGQGRMGHHRSGGHFVDADGNGICDQHPDNATTDKVIPEQ